MINACIYAQYREISRKNLSFEESMEQNRRREIKREMQKMLDLYIRWSGMSTGSTVF